MQRRHVPLDAVANPGLRGFSESEQVDQYSAMLEQHKGLRSASPVAMGSAESMQQDSAMPPVTRVEALEPQGFSPDTHWLRRLQFWRCS